MVDIIWSNLSRCMSLLTFSPRVFLRVHNSQREYKIQHYDTRRVYLVHNFSHEYAIMRSGGGQRHAFKLGTKIIQPTNFFDKQTVLE